MSSARDLNAYTKEGRLTQIEYAIKASNLGTTTISLVGKDSVVLISERKVISKQQNLSTNTKHAKIYDHIAVGYTGIGADAKTIIEKSHAYCLRHEKIYNEMPILEGLLKELATLALKFSETDLKKKIFSRPFGVNLLFAGYEKNQPVLYSFDPSGSYIPFKAAGIGGAAEAVNQELFESYRDNLADEEILRLGINTMSKVMKDPVSSTNIEVCLVNCSGVKFFESAEIAKYLE